MKRSTKAGLVLGVVFGLALGVGAYTFIYAKGGSYLTNDPKACVNCHIMQDQYDGWLKSSHRSVATCNDCHAPADFIGKYSTKAQNGFWHSFYFTTGRYPNPITITPRDRQITERACRSCHAELTAAITPGAHVTGAARGTWRTSDGRTEAAAGAATEVEDRSASCVRCHATVGHWVR